MQPVVPCAISFPLASTVSLLSAVTNLRPAWTTVPSARVTSIGFPTGRQPWSTETPIGRAEQLPAGARVGAARTARPQPQAVVEVVLEAPGGIARESTS